MGKHRMRENSQIIAVHHMKQSPSSHGLFIVLNPWPRFMYGYVR